MQNNASTPWGLGAGLRYGLLGLPLAFCALPLYVFMPNFYATQWGVSLAALGTLLLALRLFDAVLDPAIGHWVDRLAAGPFARLLAALVSAGVLLALAFAALFHPQVAAADALAWAGVSLALTYLGYSLLTVAHQSWGARLGGDAVQRSRIVVWREGLGLVGVVLASIVPALWGVTPTAIVMAVALALGLWALSGAPRPQARVGAAAPLPVHLDRQQLLAPWTDPAFVRLLVVFALNGIATAVPATLVLFFIQDRVQSLPSMQGVFLGLYFMCAALSMPLWLRVVARLGLARSWLLGMVLSVLAFAGAAAVGAGDAFLYGVVCVLSGLALGSDLAVPAALLAGITARDARSHGVYFGWWNFAAKLNLAMAAGLTLPLLGWLGYAPGARDAHSLQALTLVYCLVPCVLKLLAAAALHYFFIQTRNGESYAT